MITIRLCGGLGNQLFQWALGVDLDYRGYQVRYSTAGLDPDSGRRYLLADLGLELPLIPNIPNGMVREEKSLAFCPEMRALTGDYTLFGYFQSEKYFGEIASQIRDKVFDETKRLYFLTLSKETITTSHFILERRYDSCFIHVRRTDNLRATSTLYHGLTDAKHAPYYKRAIETMRTRFPGVTFYVFSDDAEYIKANFTDSDMVCVTHNAPSFTVDETHNLHKTDNGREVQDLYLMSLCRHAIIANSTFSWWGAWLNREQDGLVIAPDPWFSGETNLDASDIIPERWMKVSTL